MDSIDIAIKRLPNGDGLPFPRYMTEGAAGADVVAAVADALVLAPGTWAGIPTGFAFAVPAGYEMQVRGRSGLGLKKGISVLPGIGTLDEDYRGELFVILMNNAAEPFTINRGDRIGQLVIAPVLRADYREVLELPASVRGNGGLGSTGVGEAARSA